MNIDHIHFSMLADSISNSRWELQLLNNAFAPPIVEKVLKIDILLTPYDDKWVRTATVDGIATMKSAYAIITQDGYPSNVEVSGGWKNFWNIKAPPRALTLCWKLLLDRLPAGANLARLGLSEDRTCVLCEGALD